MLVSLPACLCMWRFPNAFFFLFRSPLPQDFDFKLDELGATQISFEELGQLCDVALPLLHGPYGEDGQLQNLLEQQGIVAIGSSSPACNVAFDKYLCGARLKAARIPSVESRLVGKGDDVPKKVAGIFRQYGLDEENGEVVAKPATGICMRNGTRARKNRRRRMGVALCLAPLFFFLALRIQNSNKNKNVQARVIFRCVSLLYRT